MERGGHNMYWNDKTSNKIRLGQVQYCRGRSKKFPLKRGYVKKRAFVNPAFL